MCDECKRRYDALDESGKLDLQVHAQVTAQGVVDALRGKVDPITLAVAFANGERLMRAQMDPGVLAVVDDLAARAWMTTQTEYGKRGIRLEPRAHPPMEFRDVPVRQELRVGDRPARERPNGNVRRALRRGRRH